MSGVETSALADPRLRSALLIGLAGFACLSICDALAKGIAGQWPGPHAVALRSCSGALGLAITVALTRGRAGFSFPRPMLQLCRGAAVALATGSFFISVQLMPLADATAIQFTAPILTAILSPLLLGERAPRIAIMSTLVAFAGVLVILRPNILALGPVALLPLVSAFGMAMLMNLNRKVSTHAPILEMQLVVGLVAAPTLTMFALAAQFSGIPSLHASWPPPTTVLTCLLIAAVGTFGHLFVYIATMRASTTLVAPMSYVQILMALVIGWSIFGNVPGPATLVGAGLIIVAGYSLLRRQKRTVVAMPE